MLQAASGWQAASRGGIAAPRYVPPRSLWIWELELEQHLVPQPQQHFDYVGDFVYFPLIVSPPPSALQPPAFLLSTIVAVLHQAWQALTAVMFPV
jgi:hypothetical protein